MSKTLVAYFSASGSTAAAARAAAEAVGAELFEIRPATPYTRADLNWNDSSSRSSVEMNDPASRPAIAGALPDMAQYDTVLLGFPIWWYVEPRIIDAFIDACGLAGKRVAPFATSGGSGISSAERRLRELYPEVSWLPGKLLRRGDAAGWAKSVIK